ncbi:MAG TPA: PLP-dependent aminotransferase family protein [Noviherbaspirillum sp.]|nr:PLP-dependent aminotransferase family protein [Noviherbaspirillum sp.]
MPKTRSTFNFPLLGASPTPPLHRWLYERVRLAILDGRLKPGTRLPSSRTLAEQYGMARGTVVYAFEQLIAEGYVRSGVGAGTFVSDELQDHLLQPARASRESKVPQWTPGKRALSRRGVELAKQTVFIGADQFVSPLFNPFMPALDELPVAQWTRLVSRVTRRMDVSMFADNDSLGYEPLRRNIARYLGIGRGVKVEPEQVLIVGSVQQGMDLAARLLLDPGDGVWLEDPGYRGARAIFESHGAKLIPVPVDGEGIQVDVGRRRGASAKMAYVTPSHQMPLGTALSLSRRIELLDWAVKTGAWIFEDDYDGEYRYEGRSIESLKSIDQHDRVIYAGSFSKTLFPALRVSYLVLPAGLVNAFAAARSLTARFSPVLEQAALSAFIEEGHYARHLRRMNLLYAERRRALAAAVRNAENVFEGVGGDEAGLSLLAWLRRDIGEERAVHAAKACGLFVRPLGAYALKRSLPPALILGFAGATPRQIIRAMQSFQVEIFRKADVSLLADSSP